MATVKKRSMTDFTEIKRNSDFRKVLNNYSLAFDSQKTQVSITCPFHNDASPSCKINFEKNIFNCFGCSTSGNIIDFVCFMEDLDPKNGTDFRKGALLVNTMANNVGTPTLEAQKRHLRSVTEKDIEGVGAGSKDLVNGNFEAKILLENKPLAFSGLKLDAEHAFFEERSITQAQKDRFGLGYCNRGIMKGRVCFPIYNVNNELIGYFGRWAEKELPEKTTRYRIPKGFNKSIELYNLNRLIDSKIDMTHLIIVEGFWSVIKLDELGIPVVSIFGTNISDVQIEVLKNLGVEQLTLVFDGDDAGRIGMKNSIEKVTPHFFTKILFLEEGVKPDSMTDEDIKNLV